MRLVKASSLLKIVDLFSGYNIISITIGPKVDPIVLTLSRNDVSNNENDQNRYCIFHQTNGHIHVTELITTNENFHFVQPLGSEAWVLVRATANDELDKNAHIYSLDGQCIRSFHAGHGIEDVQTTDDGKIWVSFFDEGVLSDLEFGGAGVICFNKFGEPIFKYYDLAKKNHLPFIIDCYAMNVSSRDEVWLYYYDEFPLVKLKNQKIDRLWIDSPINGWDSPMAGSKGFAVFENRALFATDKGKVFLVSLDTFNLEEIQPVDSNGNLIEFYAYYGRGSKLCLENEEGLFYIELVAI